MTFRARVRTKRFISVYDSYKVAKDVTIQRLYIEAMEEVLGNSSMTIIAPQGSGTGVVPYLPLSEMRKSGGAK